MPIKSFRGLIANAGSDTIVLHTNNGSTGYRIKKLDVMPQNGENILIESIMTVWTVAQAAVPETIDFSNQELIAAAVYGDDSNNSYRFNKAIIFDNITFNQDIYIYFHSETGTAPAPYINYYIELEQMALDLNENTVATLKDLRNND